MKLFLSCVLAMSGKRRRINCTAKAFIYNYFERECEEQEQRSSEIDLQDHEDNRLQWAYSKERCSWKVRNKWSYVHITSQTPQNWQKRSLLGDSTRKHCDNLCTISTREEISYTGYCVGGIERERQIQWGARFSGVVMLTERLCCVYMHTPV